MMMGSLIRARSRARRRIRSERVHLAHGEIDALDGSHKHLGHARAAHRRALAGFHAHDVRLVDFGDGVHLAGTTEFHDSLRADPLTLAGVDPDHLAVDGRINVGPVAFGAGSPQGCPGHTHPQLSGVALGLGRDAPLVQLEIALQLVLGVREFGQEAFDVRLDQLRGVEHRDALPRLDGVAFVHQEARDNHGGRRWSRDPPQAVSGFKAAERRDAIVGGGPRRASRYSRSLGLVIRPTRSDPRGVESRADQRRRKYGNQL